jgi:signal transduction histidine kinase/ligand-binding sensor domain-containing protein
LGILLLFCSHAWGLNPSFAISQYSHTAWPTREGFFKGVIYTMAQRADGYLWLGTEFGIIRFDGVQFTPWQPPQGQHLPSTYVRSLLFSRDGRLWIGTSDGLASFADGKITIYPRLSGQNIFSLLEDRAGTLWVGGSAPISKLCAIRGSDVQCYGEDGMFGSGVDSLHEDRAGNLWIGSMTGLWRWKPGPPQRWKLGASTVQIQSMAEGAGGALWVSFYGGITKIVGGRSEAYRAPAKWQLDPTAIVRDRDGAVWIGTRDHGLIHVRSNGTDLFAKPDGLSSDLVSTMFEDREGNMWVATLDALHRFRDFAVPSITTSQGLSDDLLGTVVRGSDGSIWLGTFHGADRWRNGEITVYPNPILADASKKQNAMTENPTDSPNRTSGISPTLDRGVSGPAGIPEGMVTPLFRDAQDRIWFSTPQGLLVFEGGRLSDLGAEPWGQVVISIVADRDGSIWINDQNRGLTHLGAGGAVIEQLSWARLGHQDWALALASDPVRNGIWIGFRNGGLAFLADGHIRREYTAVDGLGSGRVNALQFDPEGALWAATQGGVSRLKDGHIATLSARNGLPCDDTDWVAEDDDRSLWFLTSCGLVRIRSSALAAWTARIGSAREAAKVDITVFDSADGVIRHTRPGGHNPRVARTSNNTFWFLPLDGVSVLDPRRLARNALPPPVHLKQITADHKTYWRDSGSGVPSNVSLPPNVRDLEIDYAALSLVAPEKVRFRYKLERVDRDWQDVGTRRQAFYSNLRPSHYRFRVIACNNSGVWNESGAFLDFSIAPAFYQTAWFLTSCVIAFVGLLAALYRYRMHQVAQEFNVRLAERVEERSRIARELHDTLLQSLHGLLFRFQAVNNLLPARPAEAKLTLESALDSTAKTITEARDAVHDLRSSAVIENDLATTFRSLAEELIQLNDSGAKHRVCPAFLIQETGMRKDLHPMIRDEIYHIVGEGLRNALRHAQAASVRIELRYDEEQFSVAVRDDGCGIDRGVLNQNVRGLHWGLTGMRERAERIRAELSIGSEAGTGTTVTLGIPARMAYQAHVRPTLRLFCRSRALP